MNSDDVSKERDVEPPRSVEQVLREESAALVEHEREKWLRLEFFAWLFCLKVLSATLFTWPFLLHTATILPAPDNVIVKLSWQAILDDPFSWLCLACVCLCGLTWSIAVTGLLRQSAGLMAIGRMLWLIIVLLTLAISTAVWVLRRTFRPWHRRAVINPAIIQPEYEIWFIALLIIPLLTCLIGSILTDCTKKLEIVFKAEEIIAQRRVKSAVDFEELTNLTAASV